MATIPDLAKQYSDYIRLNHGNPAAISEIASKINRLVYTESRRPLSADDKNKLIKQIQKFLSLRRQTPDGQVLVEAEDSTELIRLIKMLREQTGAKGTKHG